MLRLTANKTKLYHLVKKFEPLPPMGRTEFRKAYRSPDYWLRWTDDGLWCEAFLSTCVGKPMMSIDKGEFCGQRVSRVVYGLDIEDLKARGMVEEFTSAVERRRAEACHE